MKNLYLLLTFAFSLNTVFSQSNLILPQGATFNNSGNILKTGSNAQGYNHTDGTVGVGTFVDYGAAYIQTHTPHPLNFTVNNGSPAMTLSYSATTPSLHRNFGINTYSPQEKLHVVGNIRTSSLEGTGVRNVYADANGTLTTTPTPISHTLLLLPSSFVLNSNDATTYAIGYESVINGATIVNSGTNNSSFQSQLNLPNGAVVTNVEFCYKDNSAANLQFTLTRDSFLDNTSNLTLVGSATTGAANINQINSINTNFTIDENKVYLLSVSNIAASSWDTNLRFRGVKITYSL